MLVTKFATMTRSLVLATKACFVLLFILCLSHRVAFVVAQVQLATPLPAFNKLYPNLSPTASGRNLSSYGGNRRVNQVAHSSDPKLMYPYDASDYLTEINSMKQFHDQPLHFRLPFFGFAYHYIWIHKDGYVSFNRGMKSYEFPLSFPMVPEDTNKEEDPSMMAIFFAHQDIPSEVAESGVYLRIQTVDELEDPEYKKMVLANFDKAMAGSGGFVPKFVIIITWRNMTFANRRPNKPLKTNTYQMVIATDEVNTFVFYNYEWITWITHLDNFDGLNGPNAFVGFNGGNSTRAFEFVPYSQNPRISLLPLIGYGNNIRGRSVFQVHDVLFPGSCIDKGLDPSLPDRMALTTSVNFISSLGGELLEVTGPCFWPESKITCRFETYLVKGHFVSNNVAICITPHMHYEGYIDLIVTVDDKTYFYTRLYIESPESRREHDVWVEQDDYIDKNPDLIDEKEHILEIKWRPALIGNVSDKATISVWSYQEIHTTVYPRMTWILDIVRGVPNTGLYQLNLNELPRWQLDRYDFTFGFIGVNITDRVLSMTEWSRPMPLGWLLRQRWRHEYGLAWQENLCRRWFEREDSLDYFATTVFRCPCKLEQAELDKGRFAPDEQCNVFDKKCDSRHLGAMHCVRTARPSIGGSGQQCCYDEYGELIRTADTMFGGRPSRSFIYGKHPFKMAHMAPTFSYWLHDIMPFYYCCKWAPREEDSQTCHMFNYFRTSQDCSSYQPVAVGSIFGDPHIITYDQLNYTFNGKGEYVLTQVDSPIHKFQVHGRFEQLPDTPATMLTAVAVRDNISSIVEFRIRPPQCRWFNQMFIVADKEYLYYWHDNMHTIHTRGVTIYQPSGVRNMSHLIAMFDSGAGVEVLVNAGGSLSLHVYLPNTFKNATKGLLGHYSGNSEDDFMLPNGNVINAPSRLTREQVHKQFGTKYRLLEINQPNISQSLFFHDVVSHSNYDDSHFEPAFKVNIIDESEQDMDRVCSHSTFCRYDYIVTGDSHFAENTKKEEAIAQNMASIVNDRIVRCPSLEKPINGRKSENRYWPGTIVRFSCNDGYRLIGYEVRRCREDGLWSWGVEPQCVRVVTYNVIVTSMVMAFLLPSAAIIALMYFSYRWHIQRYRGWPLKRTEQTPSYMRSLASDDLEEEIDEDGSDLEENNKKPENDSEEMASGEDETHRNDEILVKPAFASSLGSASRFGSIPSATNQPLPYYSRSPFSSLNVSHPVGPSAERTMPTIYSNNNSQLPSTSNESEKSSVIV